MNIINKVQNFVQTAKRAAIKLAVKVKVNTIPVREVLTNNRGDMLAIAIGAIITVVLGILILGKFTGLFNETVFPSITSKTSSMFS